MAPASHTTTQLGGGGGRRSSSTLSAGRDGTSQPRPAPHLQNVRTSSVETSPDQQAAASVLSLSAGSDTPAALPTVFARTARKRHAVREPQSVARDAEFHDVDAAASRGGGSSTARSDYPAEPSPEPMPVHAEETRPRFASATAPRRVVLFSVGDVLQRNPAVSEPPLDFGGRVGVAPVGTMVCVADVFVDPAGLVRYRLVGGEKSPGVDIRPFFTRISSLDD